MDLRFESDNFYGFTIYQTNLAIFRFQNLNEIYDFWMATLIARWSDVS